MAITTTFQFTYNFAMKTSKHPNIGGWETSAILEIFLWEDLVVLKGPNFGGPMD